MLLRFAKDWEVGARIGVGGFGQVYEASSPGEPACVVKLVPKAPGAERELLFVQLHDVRNVVPVIDSGEAEGHWALVMPRADMSLRQRLADAGGRLSVTEALSVLADVAAALADLHGKVVHRDLKPENILLLGGRWCLADFGISRYAEAATASDTRKYALSAPYASPERWRAERATGATDVYAFGIVGFELLSGSTPFEGPSASDFRDQHLHAEPRVLPGLPSGLASLLAECLYKSAGARPVPGDIVARLGASGQPAASLARGRLQQAHASEVSRQGESSRRASAERSGAERRGDLFQDAGRSFRLISGQLRAAVVLEAPSASTSSDADGGWSARLNHAKLEVKGPSMTPADPWEGWQAPSFDVIAHASVAVHVTANRHGYLGRAHSLWFCDAREGGRFAWFETAFMFSPLMNARSPVAPFAMAPGEGAAKALWIGVAEYQLALPFAVVPTGDPSAFVDSWIGWFADAADGRLQHPSILPERPTQGSWRP